MHQELISGLYLFLKLCVGHPERVASFKLSLSILAASSDQALSDLIKKAQKVYEGKLFTHSHP